MEHIHETGTAFDKHRMITMPRQKFLRNYVQAQMVNMESDSFSGWFYWNFKMEGGFCAEWDFLRGLREGWIPQLPAPDVNVADVYGSCFDILFRTDDDSETVVDQFPDNPPDIDGWFSDDVVNTHGEGMRKVFGKWYEKKDLKLEYNGTWAAAFFMFVILNLVYYRMRCKSERYSYEKIPDPETPDPTVHIDLVHSKDSLDKNEKLNY